MFSDGFEKFWEAYPHKRSKGDAKKAWDKIKPSPAMVNAMIEALDWQRLERHQKLVRREWVPELCLPGKWLRAERWMDERPAWLEMTVNEGATRLQAIQDLAWLREDAARRNKARQERQA